MRGGDLFDPRAHRCGNQTCDRLRYRNGVRFRAASVRTIRALLELHGDIARLTI